MAFDLMKYAAPLQCFAVWSKAFDNDEIEKIQFLEQLQQFGPGMVGVDKEAAPPKDVRDSEIAWIHPDEHSYWVFERLGGITSRVNYDHFMYNIRGIEALQYTKYGLNQHYNWHWDVGFGWENYQRKISMTVMLSDPDDYEGGEFEICNNGDLNNLVKFKPEKGDIVFFASWMPHRVNTVTSGERKSLVAWVMGERQC